MITLTETAAFLRKAIRWGITALVVLLIIKTTITIGVNYWKALHPTPPPSPDERFGTLDAIKFPSSKFLYPSSLTLETIEGELSEASPTAKVFFMPKKLPSLLAPVKAKEFAANLGFINPPQELSRIDYRFLDPEYANRTLDLNTITNNFFLKYNYVNDPSVFLQNIPPPKNQAVNEAKSFFSNLGIWNQELDGRVETTLLRFEQGKLITATSVSKAQAIRVDFYRKDIGRFPILHPFYKESLVYAIITGMPDIKQKVIEAKFVFHDIDYENFGTYPLKSSQEAWNELLAGQGFVSNFRQEKSAEIVRKMYLAYLETEEDQNFLKPVFVFEGDNEFVAWVSAIPARLIE